jgi:hypothetical protein
MIPVNQLRTVLFFVAFAFVCFSSAAQRWVHSDKKNSITIVYDFSLIIGEAGDSSLNVYLTITDDEQKYDYGRFSLNETNVLDKAALSGMLTNNFANITKLFPLNTIASHSEFLNAMVSSVHDTISAHGEHSFVYQGLSLFNALLNGAKRNISSGNARINFTPSEGYLSAISAFVCEEDMIFNISDLKSYLYNRKLTDSTNAGIDYYLAALRNERAITLTLADIRVRLQTYFDAQNVAGRWPQGGQCGCCGNYSGNCYYWSLACLAHDEACQRCQHSWCFSGCVPSSCSGNSIAWYWYLV